MANCNNLCTAAKCAELENLIGVLQQKIDLLEAAFEAHTQQDIPQAHNYDNPHVESNLSISASWQSETLTITVADGESQDTATVNIPLPEINNNQDDPHVKSNLSISASWQSDILTISVADGESSDTTTVNIPLSEITNNQDNPHVESNLSISASWQSEILTISVADGESSDSTQVNIPLSDLVSTVFITETNEIYMNCDELENLIKNLDNSINNAFNNLDNQLSNIENALRVDINDVKDYVTIDISGSTPSSFSCPESETDSNNTPLNYSGVGLQGLHQLTKSINNNLLSVFANTCNEEAVLAAPDWWQVRIGADRPQIVCTFRKGSTRTYHSISIPHPANTEQPTAPLLPQYQKGNWQGMIVLKDNSKFIINCATKAEAENMCNLAATLIDPAFLLLPLKISLTERKGEPVGEDQMFPATIMYYSTGQKNLMPDWRVSVTSDEN